MEIKKFEYSIHSSQCCGIHTDIPEPTSIVAALRNDSALTGSGMGRHWTTIVPTIQDNEGAFTVFLTRCCKVKADLASPCPRCMRPFQRGNCYSFNAFNISDSDAADAPRIENTATKLKSSMLQELTVLLMRGMICNKRDNTLTKLRFIAHVVVALLLGAVFYDTGNDAGRVNSNIACVFFVLLFLYFSSSMPAVLVFPIEAMVFLREYLNNWYRLRSYYTAKILSDLPLQLLCPSVFIFITYYMTGQLMECNRFFRIWFICILTTILGQSSGMLVGVAFQQQLGVFLIPAINMPIILFAGFFLKFSEVAGYLQPFCTFSFFRYAFEGILQALYDGDRQRLPCSKIYCPLRLPDRILEVMDMPTVSFHTIIIALCSWIICLQVATYLVLKWKAHVARR